MNKKDGSNLQMTGRTIYFCDQNRKEWDHIPVFGQTLGEIRIYHGQGMQLLTEREQSDPTGFTKQKNYKLEEVCDFSFIMSKKLTVFAQMQNNLEILPLVEFTEAKLCRGSEQAIVTRCRVIGETAKKYENQLGNFMVKREDIDHLFALIKEYEAMPDQRDSVKNNQRIAGQDIKSINKSILEKFEILDNMVEAYFPKSQFKVGYFNSRIVTDYGTRHNGKPNDTNTPPDNK